MLFLVGDDHGSGGDRSSSVGSVVNGAVVSVRTKMDKIGVWVGVSDDTAVVREVGSRFKRYLRLPPDQQIVFEVAMVQPFDDPVAGAEDPQYGFGVRYQLPISKAWLIRADATYQILQNEADNKGVRFEVRRKF